MPVTAKEKTKLRPASRKPSGSGPRPPSKSPKPRVNSSTAAAKPSAAKASPKPASKGAPKALKTREKMSLVDVVAALEAQGSEQTRKTYLRHGAREPLFGVTAGALKVLMKRIGIDHELAVQLWQTGNHDARILAYKIADPPSLSSADLDRWAQPEQITWAGMFLAALASEGPHGRKKVREWLASKSVRLRAIGWHLVASLASNDAGESDAWFAERVAEIERTIHSAPNQEKGPMNSALIAIGGRSPALRKSALAAAGRIGDVVVDHGDTACKTPDAAASIEKTWAWADAKGFPSPAAQERERESMRTRC